MSHNNFRLSCYHVKYGSQGQHLVRNIVPVAS